MIQTRTLLAPKYHSFYERQAIERLLYSNNYFPTKSHYPIRRLRIKEKHIVPSNYKERKWHLCPGCDKLFIEDLGDYVYSYHPNNMNSVNGLIKVKRKEWKTAIHCCSKECLYQEVVKFALSSVTNQGRKIIKTRRIRTDIKEVIDKFH
ncbi:hypothetical protein KQI58_00665 [Enterococcus raffinosus]|uniref:hypothetical protein n=1 Tax=Enterococcus raffinosus TaxID=71452 RepID=UPI001C10EF3E|nr:hypothetical protein [Enterococcus raffinosus]MBU5359583.1 hypothetical protein [Enterococcus raffinosus]